MFSSLVGFLGIFVVSGFFNHGPLVLIQLAESILEWIWALFLMTWLQPWIGYVTVLLFLASLLAGDGLTRELQWKFAFPALISCNMIFLITLSETMKSAYELAMERLNAEDPNQDTKLTEAQKQELADLDKKYSARLAERKIAHEQSLADANARGGFQEAAKAQEELKVDLARIESDREAAKDKVRKGEQLAAEEGE